MSTQQAGRAVFSFSLVGTGSVWCTCETELGTVSRTSIYTYVVLYSLFCLISCCCEPPFPAVQWTVSWVMRRVWRTKTAEEETNYFPRNTAKLVCAARRRLFAYYWMYIHIVMASRHQVMFVWPELRVRLSANITKTSNWALKVNWLRGAQLTQIVDSRVIPANKVSVTNVFIMENSLKHFLRPGPGLTKDSCLQCRVCNCTRSILLDPGLGVGSVSRNFPLWKRWLETLYLEESPSGQGSEALAKCDRCILVLKGNCGWYRNPEGKNMATNLLKAYLCTVPSPSPGRKRRFHCWACCYESC
jgi:hypothetical protein